MDYLNQRKKLLSPKNTKANWTTYFIVPLSNSLHKKLVCHSHYWSLRGFEPSLRKCVLWVMLSFTFLLRVICKRCRKIMISAINRSWITVKTLISCKKSFHVILVHDYFLQEFLHSLNSLMTNINVGKICCKM